MIAVAAACDVPWYRTAVGQGLVPPQYFGVVERFSVFAAVGFNAVLGLQLFRSFGDERYA